MHRVEDVMGTTVSLDLAEPLPDERLVEELFAWMHAVDARFSTYKADSEVNRLDRGELGPGAMSPLLRDVLERCAALWTDTGGYFDAYATGRFDPSGYVKGWAVQVASDRLLAQGVVNHCVNAGGDVRVRGTADGRPWRVGVRHPWQADRTCLVVAGTDLAVATSGVYERGHHIIDPLSGEPARGLCSVTVVGPDLGTADAYATAGLAMGLAGKAWLAGLPGYESAVVTDGGEFFCSDAMPTHDGAA